MQSLSISYNSPEEFLLLKNFVDAPGFDFVRTTENSADVLVTADKVQMFKEILQLHNVNYTVTIDNVEEKVTEEYITQVLERRLQARFQDPFASGRLSFTYYPSYNEVNNINLHLIIL